MKFLKNKKTRFVALLSTLVATLSAALIISTVSWFCSTVTLQPEDQIPSSILSSYFDKNDLPDNFDETAPNHEHGSAANPYVITRPVHYYNLVRLHELGTYGFNENTYFQFGKQFGKPNNESDPEAETYPFLFYKYSDSGVYDNSGYTPYLNMQYYSGSLALAPIGSARHPFVSHIIGNNLTVTNLYINGGGYSDIGIFGYISSNGNTGPTINNLYFRSVYIDAANGSAVAPGSIDHVMHDSHLYIGYLAGHVYNPMIFSNVYINDCRLYNTTGNAYEMINTYGYFGHTDEPLDSTADSNSYTSQLNADKAYEALEYTSSVGASNFLARRYTDDKPVSERFSSAVGSSTDSQTSEKYYSIDQKNSTTPYSLSSIGYTSGDAGTKKHIRYIDGSNHLQTIENVEPENILTSKPYTEIEGINYDFYGYADGAYIYFDEAAEQWKYVEIEGNTELPSYEPISLNCFTISFIQRFNGTDYRYYLKYQAQDSGAYAGKLVTELWGENDPVPTDMEYYFCFKTTYGNLGVSRFTECSTEREYFIYSPAGKNYLCTYAPQNVHTSGTSSPPGYCDDLVHTPVFVSEDGTNGHYPMKFTIEGPKTYITYTAVDNKNTGDGRDVNADFDNNNSNKYYKGSLQGSNLLTPGAFGGHKMTANTPGGEFIIGEYIDSQTTTLTDTTNFRLTSNYSEIQEGAVLVIAGFDKEQEDDYSLDYAMATQSTNNRLVKQVREVRDKTGYVINDTTGLAKMTIHYLNEQHTQFTLYNNGYLYYDTHDSKSKNNLRTTEPDYDIETDTENQCKWNFDHFTLNGVYTRYRFQNVANNDRYLCYNTYGFYQYGGNRIFACYSKSGLDGGEFVNDDTLSNMAKWFYIYKQQTGQTIQNVHYVTSVTKQITATTYPFKDTTKTYNLKYADIDGNINPDVISNYQGGTDDHNFKIDPSYNVSFDPSQSKVQYFDTLIELWKRVSIVSELQSGDRVIIGATTSSATSNVPYYFMSTRQYNSSGGWGGAYMYRGVTSTVRFNPPYLAAEKLPSTAQQFTLVKSSLGWRFDTGTGFLYAASNTNDYLGTETTPDSNGNADFSISILSNGKARITAQGNNSHKVMQYYNSRFSCYTSESHYSVEIFKLASSTANEATYVGDLVDNFEPLRMDVTGPGVRYYSDYMRITQTPTIMSTPTVSQDENNPTIFYPTSYLKNTISILIDNTGSRDLGTLTFEYEVASQYDEVPYFMPTSNTTKTLTEAGAVDTYSGDNPNMHSYLLNINAINIPTLRLCCLKGEGSVTKPFVVCEPTDPDLTKYLVVIGCDEHIKIKSINYTFSAIPGNIGYEGTVDYRSATYDYNDSTGEGTGKFTGAEGQVTYSALSIYYDVTHTGQKVHIWVTYVNGTYTINIVIDETNSWGSNLTYDLVINIFKYDNGASTLIVVINGVASDPIYNGTTSITIEAPYPPPNNG